LEEELRLRGHKIARQVAGCGGVQG
jgi:hypothetical protein